MTRYKLTNEAKMDLARTYWRGVEEYWERQAERYYEAFFGVSMRLQNRHLNINPLIISAKVIAAVYAEPRAA